MGKVAGLGPHTGLAILVHGLGSTPDGNKQREAIEGQTNSWEIVMRNVA